MLTNKKTSSRKIAAITVIGLLLIGATVFALEKMRVTNLVSNTPPLSTEEKEEERLNDAAKQKFIEDTDPASSADQNNDAAQQTNASIELTAKQESNGSVTILTKIYGFTDGTCSLSASNADKTHSQSANIIYQPEFSSCAGFSVPLGALGDGDWTIKVTATSSSGMSSSKTINLEVK